MPLFLLLVQMNVCVLTWIIKIILILHLKTLGTKIRSCINVYLTWYMSLAEQLRQETPIVI